MLSDKMKQYLKEKKKALRRLRRAGVVFDWKPKDLPTKGTDNG